MSMYLRYYGEFVSVGGHQIRAALYQDNETEYTPEELEFPAESPLVIEWGEKSKEDVILGSSATLRIISPSDRKYLDLYSVKYGRVRLDVWRDGVFYYSAILDPEFYEEPYETDKGYNVSLTFSDFAYLDRVKFDVAPGFKAIRVLLLLALNKTQCVRLFRLSDFDESFEYSEEPDILDFTSDCPVGITDTELKNIIKSAYVRTDNFYDEDGTAKTWAEVLVAILQPLGVRMTQKNGFLYLYDFHTLCKYEEEEEISWSGSSQTLGIDKVFNNIKITWSPYAQSADLLPSEVWPDIDTPASVYKLDMLDGWNYNNALLFTYPLPYEFSPYGAQHKDPGFTLWTSTQSKNIETLESGVRVFKIKPQWDGDEAEGVAAFWVSHYTIRSESGSFVGYSNTFGFNPISQWGVVPSRFLFTSKKAFLPPQNDVSPLQIRLSMECLVDCRVNPFEEPFGYVPDTDTSTCKNSMEVFNSRAQFLYIPVEINFKPLGSSDVYQYTNKSVLDNRVQIKSFADSKRAGQWQKKGTNSVFCYLAYYLPDASERKEGTALCKWTANRQAIYLTGYNLQTILQKIEDGQYIDMPSAEIAPGGGEIWLRVAATGWLVGRYNATPGSNDHIYYTERVRAGVSFALLKMPSLDILNNNLFDLDIATNDVIYQAEVDPDAKEELTITTLCGSYVDGLPTARGLYFKENGAPIREFVRAGKTGPAEQLLCGTLLSQYYGRKVTLTGECELGKNRPLLFTEANQAYKRFIAVSEQHDLRLDTNNAKFIEVSMDNYDKE